MSARATRAREAFALHSASARRFASLWYRANLFSASRRGQENASRSRRSLDGLISAQGKHVRRQFAIEHGFVSMTQFVRIFKRSLGRRPGIVGRALQGDAPVLRTVEISSTRVECRTSHAGIDECGFEALDGRTNRNEHIRPVRNPITETPCFFPQAVATKAAPLQFSQPLSTRAEEAPSSQCGTSHIHAA